jgi:predicted nucleic-acid-binding protein
MLYVDANIVLRYILEDHDELSPAAKEIIDSNEIFVPTEVLAEIVYVLLKVYKAPRTEIRESLIAFFDDTDCGLADHDAVEKALNMFGETSFDFIDCVLAAYAAAGKAVSTFDKKLEHLIQKLLSGDEQD